MKSKLTKEFEDGYAHFLKRANLSSSFLDARAIRFMNEMPGRLVNSHDALLEACKALVNTHSMHGPCEQNSCQLCEIAYTKGKQAIAQIQK